jgi:hypothetical protein
MPLKLGWELSTSAYAILNVATPKLASLTKIDTRTLPLPDLKPSTTIQWSASSLPSFLLQVPRQFESYFFTNKKSHYPNAWRACVRIPYHMTCSSDLCPSILLIRPCRLILFISLFMFHWPGAQPRCSRPSFLLDNYSHLITYSYCI